MTRKKLRLTLLLNVLTCILFWHAARSQQKQPKLIVGIVVDQMRWEYTNRFGDVLSKDGFLRISNDGFVCDNTYLNYYPPTAANGLASIYCGTVPARHGIIGNFWLNRTTKKYVYCAEDETAKGVGTNSFNGAMSPKNLFVSTLGDQLKLSSNFASKVISVSLKDWGAIFSGGHTANAAYWYDNATGNFISSSYYMDELPAWVHSFNGRKIVDSLYRLNWHLTLPRDKYVQVENATFYHSRPFGADETEPPYDLTRFVGKDYSRAVASPIGNSVVLDMAKAAVLGENLGKDNIPDLLTISLSSTDYIGHSFGPASIELEDSFIKLDRELGTFLAFLDSSIGPNSYLLFLTSDHGVADIPGYLVEKKIPAGYINPDQLLRALETDLKGRFGDYNWVESYISNSLYLNDTSLSKTGVSRDSVVNEIKSFLYKEQHVFKVLDIKKLPNEVVDEGTKALLINGMFPARSEPDVSVLYEPNWIEGGPSGTTHSSIFTYDNHVPLMWYGFGIKPERDFESLNLTDIAPTITALLGLDKPNAATGRLIVPLIKNINGYERN